MNVWGNHCRPVDHLSRGKQLPRQLPLHLKICIAGESALDYGREGSRNCFHFVCVAGGGVTWLVGCGGSFKISACFFLVRRRQIWLLHTKGSFLFVLNYPHRLFIASLHSPPHTHTQHTTHTHTSKIYVCENEQGWKFICASWAILILMTLIKY